jgi:hypothetical protein
MNTNLLPSEASMLLTAMTTRKKRRAILRKSTVMAIHEDIRMIMETR